MEFLGDEDIESPPLESDYSSLVPSPLSSHSGSGAAYSGQAPVTPGSRCDQYNEVCSN